MSLNGGVCIDAVLLPSACILFCITFRKAGTALWTHADRFFVGIHMDGFFIGTSKVTEILILIDKHDLFDLDLFISRRVWFFFLNTRDSGEDIIQRRMIDNALLKIKSGEIASSLAFVKNTTVSFLFDGRGFDFIRRFFGLMIVRFAIHCYKLGFFINIGAADTTEDPVEKICFSFDFFERDVLGDFATCERIFGTHDAILSKGSSYHRFREVLGSIDIRVVVFFFCIDRSNGEFFFRIMIGFHVVNKIVS